MAHPCTLRAGSDRRDGRQTQVRQKLQRSQVLKSVATTLFLLAAFAPGASAAAAAAAKRPPGPDLKSGAFYILDESDSKVLAARNERVAVPIASITKLMTALVVLEAAQSMDETIAITQDDVRGTTGSSSRLAPGARLSRADLLHLALMSSENRAAHALCRRYVKGPQACVSAMNAKAKALGMKTARFVEPTGLSSANVASPEDLVRLVRAASANATIREYSTDPEHTVQVNRQSLEFRNTNLLVDKSNWQVTVQKTGYIAEAGRCLVMETVIDGRNVVIVLLNSWGRLTRIGDANRIRTWMEASRPPTSG
jgi:D-alanyl-D-alanine endopeptidase (penicillin-binding protein 7)